MKLDTDSLAPIYIQIADWLENEILNEHFKPDEKVFSQYKLAELFNINPATAAKGLNLLSDEGILYTKRGLGKFAAANAREIILNKRRDTTLKEMVVDLAAEARRLGVSEEELLEMVGTAYEKRKGEL